MVHHCSSSAEKGRVSSVPSLFCTSCSTRCSADFRALWHSRVSLTPRSKAASDCSRDSSPCSRSRTSCSSSFRDFSKSAMEALLVFSPAMGRPPVGCFGNCADYNRVGLLSLPAELPFFQGLGIGSPGLFCHPDFALCVQCDDGSGPCAVVTADNER